MDTPKSKIDVKDRYIAKEEQKIQREILSYLNANGYYAVKVVAATRIGVPDIIGCLKDGGFFAFEVKRPGGEVSRLQRYNIDKIRDNKGLVMIVTSVDQVKKLLK